MNTMIRRLPKMTSRSDMRRAVAGLLVAALCCLAAVAPASAAPQGVVNVNEADAETLQMLPRVGPSVAGRIIEHRESNGKFQDKTDLLLVRGIGDATYELLEPYVTLEGPSTLNEKVRVPRRASAADEEGTAERGDAAEGRVR